MGRVCCVPSLLWAEFVMCRVDPTPGNAVSILARSFLARLNNVRGELLYYTRR